MNYIKNILSILAVVFFLAPTAINFVHVFSGHSHQICEHYAEDHFHTQTLDCELHQFQKNPALSIFVFEFIPTIPVPEKEQLPDYYQFLNDHIKLPFELRGPPLT